MHPVISVLRVRDRTEHDSTPEQEITTIATRSVQAQLQYEMSA